MLANVFAFFGLVTANRDESEGKNRFDPNFIGKPEAIRKKVRQCHSIKWGDGTLTSIGAGTKSDPCKYIHPDFSGTEVFPIKWNQKETLGVVFEKKWVKWQDAFNRCNELGMTLPLPLNDEQNNALKNFMYSSDHTMGRIFLGSHNSNDNRTWVNLYTNDAINYNQWFKGQPDNDGNAEKVAEMLSNGEWNDLSLSRTDNRGVICIKVDYENWDVKDMNMANFFCETGLNQCHATAVCREYTGTSPTHYDYQCECDDIDVQGITLIPDRDIVSPLHYRCKYTVPGLTSLVNSFIYDGKPTVYHQTGSLSFANAIKYCAELGMHLPVPNSEQEYQDLKTISRYGKKGSFWLGYTDITTQGTWLNIYNGEELIIDKWAFGPPKIRYNFIEMQQYGSGEQYGLWDAALLGPKSYYGRSTLCLMTDLDLELEVELDFCEMKLHDCNSDTTCANSGNSYICICPNAQIGNWNLEPASTSTGKGSDGCHYFHPNADGHRVLSVKYGGRDTAVYIGPVGSNLYDHAAKCHSLEMKMLTPQNLEENSLVYELRSKPGGNDEMSVSLGVTRRYDGQWRNIYTNNKTWTNFYSGGDLRGDWYGTQDFAYVIARYSEKEWSGARKWNGNDFGGSWKTTNVCIAPKDGESIEIDYCGTGFNDCHAGATCINGGDAGYICECQPLQFGDFEVAPIDVAGSGKSCTYQMPGHEDKTLLPVRVYNNTGSDIVYAFHASSETHLLKDAILYCGALGMHLPLPMNDMENAAMRKVLPGQYISHYWLGISHSDKDLKYLNIYTGEEHPYTNWAVGEPKSNVALNNFGLNRGSGKWYSNYENKLRTICQKSAIDVSKVDWCGAGLHNCNVDAYCFNDGDTPRCECKDQEFYSGDGVGENGCVFKLGSKFLIDKYNVEVTINDRYVRTQIAVSVSNKNTNNAEYYEFGVNLDEFEFVSGLTMRMGDDGDVFIGDVHKEQEAQEIFDNAVSNGSGGAITEIKPTEIAPTETQTSKNTTFSVKVNLPAGEKVYIWLNYDMQLTRERAFYAYTTNVFPFDVVSKMRVTVTIEESRNIDPEKTAVYWESEGKPKDLRATRYQENKFILNKASGNRWKFLFEKESIQAEQWNDNLMIEYDLERLGNICGDIVLRDGYFIHYIAPKGLGSIPKNVILTVDTSGSMAYTRMNNAKAAMINILDSLTDQDRFWLQQFNSFTSSWTSDTVQATVSNIENAKIWVNSLSAGGGTALYSAILNSIQRPLDSNRANLAFIISDGYPTSGITKWSDIQANILAANSIKNSQGEEIGQKWAIYNFGIGNGAPMFELSKLSTWNMGVGRQVFDDADVHTQLTEFFKEYSIPLVWNNQFHYSGASEYDCSGTNLYADQELTCIGKLPSSNSCGDVKNLGFTPGNTLLSEINMMNVSVSNTIHNSKYYMNSL